MLCTGNFTYGGVDACAGDSGGRYETIYFTNPSNPENNFHLGN